MTDANTGTTRWQGLLGSMRFRILAAVVLLLVLASALSLVLLRQVLFVQLDDEIAQSLDREMQEFLRLRDGVDPETSEPFGDDFAALFDTYFRREVPDEGESLLSFIDGEIYLSERARDAAEDDELTETIDYWLGLDAATRGTRVTSRGAAPFIAQPLVGADGQEALFVVVNFPEFERNEITEALSASAAIQLGTLVLAIGLGLLLAGRVLRPLRSLAVTARTISDTDLSRRIAVPGTDEASQIAQTFNDMLNRLEQAFSTQRRFLDDAGHELRTPLQVISGHVELLDLDDDPAQRRETVALVLDEVARMNRMVNDLLLLARSEQPDFVTLEPVDIAVLTDDVVRKASALGDRQWRMDHLADVTVLADGQRLTQAWMQLAENAARYTSDGGVIRIGSAADGATVRLWVHDDGPGVAPEDAELIFDRFVRGAQRVDGGAGLGLSIVEAIVTAHGGSVRLDQSVAVGARFEITLPRRPT